MTGAAGLHDDAEQWLAREVAIGSSWPSGPTWSFRTNILPPGPHEHNGSWMTLWKFVPHEAQAPPPEPGELGRSLRELHAALADFPGDLAPLSVIRDWLERLLAELRPSPPLTQQDIDGLRFELEVLTPPVFESSLSVQALMATPRCRICCVLPADWSGTISRTYAPGPVAWDIAGLVASARTRGQSAKFIDELLAAYGEPGVESLETFIEAHAVYDIVWQAFEARRRPRAMKRAAASLALWCDRRAG